MCRRMLFGAAIAVLLLSAGGSAWAGAPGKFAIALKNKFCNGTTGPEWYGCYAYMYYRVDGNNARDTAHSYCKTYGCGNRYNGVDQEMCLGGCKRAYDSDTR